MREILFRGKRLDNEKWVEGHLVVCKNNGRSFITELIEVDEDSWLYWEVNPNTVGQYTGLTDKNGNKIFEGDIIRCNNRVEVYIGLVDWDICNPSMCIRYTSEKGFDHIEYDFIICGNMTIEILGNIHDNPELMKGGRK